MNWLTGLNGTVAAVLLCCLLFVDEAGLPLPIAPSEGMLLLAGVLVASNDFPLWLIVPILFVAMAAGMFAGYGWARAAGPAGLGALAARVNATDVYERVRARLQSASPLGIAVARLVPGIRPYATLVSGAGQVDPRVFALGAVPALLVWELVWIVTGMLIGLPVAHLFGHIERLALRGIILIGLGAVSWLAIRDLSPDRRSGIAGIAPRLRASLALLADTAIVGSAVVGLFAVTRRLLNVTANGWIEILAVALALIAVLILGRGAQTPGERLFETDYWHRPHRWEGASGAREGADPT